MNSAVVTQGSVLIVGAGLLGTSIGLALQGVEIYLDDSSPTALALAESMGAGLPLAKAPKAMQPALVIVATPPDVAGSCVVAALAEYPEAIVTDVASVKSIVASQVLREAQNVENYIGSHPMAGRERSGASAADADLFVGRPWVIVPTEATRPDATATIRNLAADLGSVPYIMSAAEHDSAVAVISHLPQLVSSLLAAQLVDAPSEALALVGQGLRDTTRIANSDSRLWASIIAGNLSAVSQVFAGFVDDAADLLSELTDAEPLTEPNPNVVGAVTNTIIQGNKGVERIPGKHGGAPRRYLEVSVVVPDKPGELGRLFTEVGLEDVNIEDVQLEHSAFSRAGIARLQVDPQTARELAGALQRREWQVITSEN